MRARTVWTGIAALSVVVLTACSSGHATRSSSAGGSAGSGTAAIGGGGALQPEPAALPANGYSADAGSSPKVADNATPALVDSRKLIRTASISVRVKSIDSADRIRVIATGVGGQVDGDDRSSGDDASATVVLEIPPDKLDDVLTKIAALGTELGRQSSTKDVTTEVADVNSRVISAQVSIDRLNGLFKQATKVDEIIAIERELSQREADLESLQAQQKALKAETEMARVTVGLSTTTKTAKKHDRGLIGGIKRGWHNFTGAIVSTLTGLGIVGPFVLALVLAAGAARVVVRRRRANAATAGTS